MIQFFKPFLYFIWGVNVHPLLHRGQKITSFIFSLLIRDRSYLWFTSSSTKANKIRRNYDLMGFFALRDTLHSHSLLISAKKWRKNGLSSLSKITVELFHLIFFEFFFSWFFHSRTTLTCNFKPKHNLIFFLNYKLKN